MGAYSIEIFFSAKHEYHLDHVGISPIPYQATEIRSYPALSHDTSYWEKVLRKRKFNVDT